jgi:hypothetical protein
MKQGVHGLKARQVMARQSNELSKTAVRQSALTDPHIMSPKEFRVNCRISLAVLLLGSVAWLSSGHPASAADPVAAKDIVDTAVAAGSFKTLAAAVRLGVSTLSSRGPFTVFARPTICQTSVGTVETLLKPENREARRGAEVPRRGQQSRRTGCEVAEGDDPQRQDVPSTP